MPRRPQIQRPLYCLYKSLLRAALVPFVVAVAAASELPSERLECENIKSNATFSGSSGLVLAAFDGFLDALVGFNGIYDMGCCIAILTLPLWRISTLHISVFSDDLGNIGSMLWHRLLAYWIFTYGIARFASAVVRHPALDGISAATYLIEAIVRSRNLDLSSHTQKWYHCVNTFLRFLCSPRLPLCVPTSTSNRRAQNFGPASSVRHWMDMLRVWSRGFNRGAWGCH